jgi:hypothetical protein
MNSPKSSFQQTVDHVRDAEQRVLRQEQLVSRLEADGHDTAEALRVLDLLMETLEAMRNHLVLEQKGLDLERKLSL